MIVRLGDGAFSLQHPAIGKETAVRNLLVASACPFAVVLLGAAGGVLTAREALLPVSAGTLPTDTGSDGGTKFAIEERPELGGKSLKVAFAPGDSFGDRAARIADWKRFIALEFEASNPASGEIRLTLVVRHRRTTGYQTRVDVPIALKPGKNSVRIGIDEMMNMNGTVPDLSAVLRWYLACEEGKSPILYFGDLWLTGEDPPRSSPGGEGKVAGGDPARLARIRAAKMPEVRAPVQFCTPEADAILSALEVFPPDNPWNAIVEDWPLHPDSERIIASIGAEKPLRCNSDMGFVLVPPSQPRVEVKIADYSGESDPGPFPIPDSIPIEGWPVEFDREIKERKLTLDDVQRDRLGRGGDRHGIIVDPVGRKLYEFFVLKRTDAGWQAAQASAFDLASNALRPDGWTSADAAGLPIFPAVVRHDELRRGIVEHALRVTVRRTRRAYVAPATHFASPHQNPEYSRMGERIRLRRDFDVSGFSPEARAILVGLKRYGMLVADNGIDWAISVAPDPRIPVLHEELRRVKGAAFEVVVPPGK
jgi:hypothetical protein